MSRESSRLDRLFEGLTAKDRARLVLRSWKEGKDEDPSWRLSMPPEQAREFNRYIGLMNGVNQRLGPYTCLIHEQVGKLDLRLGWLATLALWGLYADQLDTYVQLALKEPITASEHQELAKEARSTMAPAGELADLLAERHEEWTEDDLEPAGEGKHSVVKEAAWERVLKGKEDEIDRLVAEGTLEGKRKGRRLLVNLGSFYDWLGEEVPLAPEWGLEYEVFPDGQAERVRVQWRLRQDMQKALHEMPASSFVWVEGDESPQALTAPAEDRSKMDELGERHKTLLREGVQEQWRRLRAGPARGR